MAFVQVINETRHTIIAQRTRLADSGLLRLVGLMGQRALPPNGGLLIRPCSSMHTFGMRFAIDVLYVNQDDIVVDILQALPPWNEGISVPSAAYVLELPSGTIAATSTQQGDSLSIGYA